MSEELRRVEDKGNLAIAGRTVKATGTGIWNWIEKRHIPAHAVIGVTIWLTVEVVQWAMDYPERAGVRYSGMEVAAIQAAVLGPWGFLQGAMFKFYSESIRNGGTNANAQS